VDSYHPFLHQNVTQTSYMQPPFTTTNRNMIMHYVSNKGSPRLTGFGPVTQLNYSTHST